MTGFDISALLPAQALLLGLVCGLVLVFVTWLVMKNRQTTQKAVLMQEVKDAVEFAGKLHSRTEELDKELKAAIVARAHAEQDAKRVAELETEVNGLREQHGQMATRAAQIEAAAREQAESHKEKLSALTTLKGDIEKNLKALAGEALQANQKSFLDIANEVLTKHNKTAQTDLEQRQKSIETLLNPINKTLEDYKKNLGEIEKSRQEAYGNLSTELKNVLQTQYEVRKETSNLVNALRAAPKTRGRWGEETLRNVMELSGMSEHCDFETEQTFKRDEATLRPDVIIRLPGARFIVVDAKAPMTAYLEAIEQTDDDARKSFLDNHARQVRDHMKKLGAKDYWRNLTVTPDFVAMFIPGDNFFAAAMEHDADLFNDAIEKKVLIVTPTTLIALAKAVAYGWQQEAAAKNAHKAADLGKELYKRMVTMGNHIDGLGKNLEKTVKKYNSFVGSIESQVLPQARKFTDLDVDNSGLEIIEPPVIETETRELRADRDLLFLAGDTTDRTADTMAETVAKSTLEITTKTTD